MVNFLLSSLELKDSELRCTSVPGHQLPLGVEIAEYLRKDIQLSTAILALLTKESLLSQWVLFKLKKLLDNPDAEWEHMAITTYARNNHAIRDQYFRYIHYGNGAEKLYDHRKDDTEWYNLANDPEYEQVKERLKQYLPKVNEPWAPTNRFDYNKYLKEQRIRESE